MPENSRALGQEGGASRRLRVLARVKETGYSMGHPKDTKRTNFRSQGLLRPRTAVLNLVRRGRDSNPGYRKRYTGFRDRRLQPLGHLSKLRLQHDTERLLLADERTGAFNPSRLRRDETSSSRLRREDGPLGHLSKLRLQHDTERLLLADERTGAFNPSRLRRDETSSSRLRREDGPLGHLSI